MIDRETARRLSAWAAGRPLPYGETKHRHIADDQDALIVAFVRMGGESSPWGIAWGHPHSEPEIASVPEARNRTLVSEMCGDFALAILEHFRHPAFVDSFDPEDSGAPVRQIWVPNQTHLDMLQNLAFRFAFTKWESPLRELLQQFGRLCNWLFQESQRPGQQVVVVGTDLLRSGWTFPAESTRQGHLGFLLAWLSTRGARAARYRAAVEAERMTIATSLDPALERTELDDLVSRWGKARREKDTKAMKRAAASISAVLEPELDRRWRLTEVAIDTYRKDRRRRNSGIDQLVRSSCKEFFYSWYRQEKAALDGSGRPPFFPSVETDRNAAAAASRFLQYDAAAEDLETALVHDDRELLADAVQSGDALIGVLAEVTDESSTHSGKGRRPMNPVWILTDTINQPLRLREGSGVVVVGAPKRAGEIRDIREEIDGARTIEIAITGGKTSIAGAGSPHEWVATDARLVGHEVAFVKKNMASFTRKKSSEVWKKSTAGSWLTHSRSGGDLTDVDPDDQDDRDIATEQQ